MRFFGAGAFVPIVAAALWLSACAESSMLPAAPSPLPVDKIGRLGIACPAGSQAQSFDGGPVTVHFGAPVPSGGQQPVTVGCTPHSGSAFNIGSTDVTCGASDALQQTASCAFRVTVRGPPKLAVSGVRGQHHGRGRLSPDRRHEARFVQCVSVSTSARSGLTLRDAGHSGDQCGEGR